MNNIRGFNGAFRFLSNFTPAVVSLDGVQYPSIEHAYQAAKSLDERAREKFTTFRTPAEAKSAGKRVTVSPCWESRKLEVMLALLRQKFALEPYRSLLLSTAGAGLIEDNHWGDRFWGVCRGEGLNHLGRLLEQVRAELAAGRFTQELPKTALFEKKATDVFDRSAATLRATPQEVDL